MNDEPLRRELLLLVGYLLTSAHGLYDEPPDYGPFRLMDAAGRLLEIMDAHGMSDPFLGQLQAAIQAECSGSKSERELKDALNGLCVQYAVELKARVGVQEDKG